MIAFLFVGQGAEPPWVEPELLAAPPVAGLLARASEATGVDVGHLLARGGRELARTEVQQPAMVAVCLGVARLLADAGVSADLAIGHSLGELAAWSAAGAIACEDAVGIAALRGRLMAREAAAHPGGMVRLVGDRDACERAIAACARHGALCIGANNGGGEWALSGDAAAIAHAIARCGATRLPMAGAWHSPAMAGAHDELLAALAAVPRRPMRARMVSNRDGAIVRDDDAPARLAGQLLAPVDWAATLATAIAAGVTRYVVVGPGKILRALLYRTLGVGCEVEIADSARAIAAAAGR